MELQRLPIPVGSTHAVRRAGRVWRPGGPRLLTLLGLLAAGAGALLGAAEPEVAVTMDEHAYRLAGIELPAQGGGVYSGAAGAVVVARSPGGTRAGASTTLHGAHMTGSCLLDPGGRRERCTFQLDGHTVTAADEFDGSGWRRRYSDGQDVHIDLPGRRPVPVPIAVGR